MRVIIAFLGALVVAFGPSAAHAQKGNAPARCTAVSGVLLTPSSKGPWTSVAADSDVPAEKLLVALFGADFSVPGVMARVAADVGHRGPFPVLEAAIRFHDAKSIDLDVSLERGILVLTNTKKSGPALVNVRLRAEVFHIELHEPKARLGIEVYGRHAPGPAKLDNPKEDDPVANVAFFAIEGETVITNAKHSTRLHAPPGPALYIWDNVTHTPEVVRFETLPDSLKPMTPDERKQFDALAGFAKAWAANPAGISKALEQSAAKKDPVERKAAVVAMGALDDLPRVVQALHDKDHADVRDAAVVVLRHWLGREPGQSMRLYDHLTKAQNLKPTQAKNFLHYINGFELEKRRHPETYTLLIQTLNHEKIVARHLAHWHLTRLVPDGKDIAYDAAAPEAQRQQAMAAWRKLIPEGELPPPPKKKQK